MAAAYASKRPSFLDFLKKTQNPRLIKERGFKPRVAYDGARTVTVDLKVERKFYFMNKNYRSN
jgi:hypothetical protein